MKKFLAFSASAMLFINTLFAIENSLDADIGVCAE